MNYLPSNLADNAEPFAELRAELQQQLGMRITAEQNSQQAEASLSEFRRSLEELTKIHIDSPKSNLLRLKPQWQSLQMERQALLVRQTTIQEQLTEQNWVLNDLMAALNTEANSIEWEKQLQTVTARIERLGAINLAAIDEYQTVNESENLFR